MTDASLVFLRSQFANHSMKAAYAGNLYPYGQLGTYDHHAGYE